MYTVKLKDGTSYKASYVDESYRKGVYSLTMNLADDATGLNEYAAAFDSAASEINIVDDETGKEMTFTGYGEVSVSRHFAENLILVRVTKEQEA